LLYPRKLLLAGLISATLFRPAFAKGEDWSLCAIPSFLFVSNEEIAEDETRIEAQTVVGDLDESIRLSGDVRLQRRDLQINADEVILDRINDQLTASGNASYTDPDYRIRSSSAHIDNRNDQAWFDQSQFELRQRHARGEASSIEKIDDDRSRHLDIMYTTCDPGDNAWYMRAKELDIDRESGVGEALHTTMYIKDVPVLYLPYFQFPIDDRRKSGLLTPSFGFGSQNGGSLLQPIYWNMAPNYDMTITPAWYGKRGLQLNTENRYLFEKNSGQIDLSYMDDQDFGDTRWFRQLRHTAALPFGIKANALLAKTSDDDFFYDFSSVAPEYGDTRYLERYVRLHRTERLWQGELVWRDYQTLDHDTSEANRPYNSLPRISLDARPEPWLGEFTTPVHLEWVNFERNNGVEGKRSHVVTSLNWNSENSWHFFRPNIQFAFTDYQLEDNPGGDSLNRALPTLSVDSGLIFERPAGNEGQWRQTLEPRLYFLHTPYDNQDDIPDFDTSVASQTYRNLFRNNRFNGADRIGDATQVTFGLASRLFDNASGAELLHARIGQIYYFKDRRVTLNGEPKDNETSKSDIIAEVDFRPFSSVVLGTRVVYDPQGDEFVDRQLSLSYRHRGLAANLGYYYTEDDLEQALVSVAYPINERWGVVGKLHRSLEYEKPVENLLGISYQSCCWGLKILAGQTGDYREDFAETENSIFFEFTFKGLSRAGEDIDRRLYNAIPGYKPAF